MMLPLALVVGFFSATTDASQEAVSGSNRTEACNHDEEQHIEPAYAVLMPWFAQAVGIVVYYLSTRNKYLSAVPYTAVMFITGIFMGCGTEFWPRRVGSIDAIHNDLETNQL